MRKASISIGLLGILALSLGACSGEDNTATQPSPTVSASPAAPPVAASPPATAQPFSTPPVVPPQPVNLPAVAGLVQSTNADERARAAAKGRQDPFAVLPVQPIITVSPDPNATVPTRVVPQVPTVQPQQPSVNQRPRATQSTGRGRSPISRARQVASQVNQSAARRTATGVTSAPSTSRSRTTIVVNPSARRRTTVVVRPGTTKTRTTVARNTTTINRRTTAQARTTIAARPGVRSTTPNAGSPATLPSLTAPPLFTPQLPPLPEPELARNVEVTGIIQVGGLPQAIVRAPNETASRYVQPGQRLSNGQVLVKRIEMNEGSAPIVILEQYGIEVARQVGDRPAGTRPGTPTAAIPVNNASSQV